MTDDSTVGDGPGAPAPTDPLAPRDPLVPTDPLALSKMVAPAEPHPWAEDDRPRGLDAVFPPGGEDEAPLERVADERRMTRLLVLFVALLVGIPTVLTLIGFVAQLVALRGGG